MNRINSPLYNRASEALDAAHKACLTHPDLGPVGMSCPPFDGVNVALGIIAQLEDENKALRAALADGQGRESEQK